MTSSITSVPLGVPEKPDGVITRPIQLKPQTKRCNQVKNSRLTNCGQIAKKCFGEKFRPTAGLCMIAFAVPLIVPGITLTVVAFEDHTGSSKYNALHVLGMVLLGLAILLITFGVLLNTRLSFKIFPGNTTRMLPSQEQTAKEYNIDLITSNKNNHPYKNNVSTVSVTSLPSIFHVVPTDNRHFNGSHKPRNTSTEVDMNSDNSKKCANFSARKFSKGQNSSEKSFPDYSSSFDSVDSDDASSGSYILIEDAENEPQTKEFKPAMGYVQEIDKLRSFTTFKPGNLNKSLFNFEEFKCSSVCETDINASPSSVDKLKGDLNVPINNETQNKGYEIGKNRSDLDCIFNDEQPPGGGDKAAEGPVELQGHEAAEELVELQGQGHRAADESADLQGHEAAERPVELQTLGHKAAEEPVELQVETNSPVSRQRLHGLSSHNVLATSSDMLAGSCDSLKQQDVVFDENVSASNTSVFSLEPKHKWMNNLGNGNSLGIVLSTKELTSNPQKTWAETPPTPRPHSFPSEGVSTGSTGTLLRKNSLGEIHVTRQSPGWKRKLNGKIKYMSD